jgi:hypothetical protein
LDSAELQTVDNARAFYAECIADRWYETSAYSALVCYLLERGIGYSWSVVLADMIRHDYKMGR